MFRRARGMTRHIPAFLALMAIVGGYVGLQMASTANADERQQLASTKERGVDDTVSRGASAGATSAIQLQAVTLPASPVATESTTTVAPPPTAVVTTTSAVPVTAALVTTTTATPAPTTTSTTTSTTVQAPASEGANSQTGGASYYTHKPGGCAHKTLPMGTAVTVTNLANNKTSTCVVNDRGPFVAGRIVDLDITVFRQLASTSAGVFRARISW